MIRGDKDEGYLAEVPELPASIMVGAIEEEALASLRGAMTGWLMTALAHGLPIPEPEYARSAWL